MINIVLTYFVAWKLFARRDAALCAAFFIALTPAHFIHSRVAMDYLHPVPFILGWLYLFARYLNGARERTVAVPRPAAAARK